MVVVRRCYLCLHSLLIIALMSACGSGGGTTSNTSVDNTPRFAYVINSQVIGSYIVDPESGNLIPRGNSQQFFEVAPTDVEVHPNGRFLYLSDYSGLAGIKRREINPRTGVFSTDMPSYRYSTTGAQDIAIHPSGDYLFFSRSGFQPITSLALDPVSGDMSLVGETEPLAVNSIHLASDGSYLYAVSGIGGTYIYTFRVQGDGSLILIDADPGTAGKQPQLFSDTALGIGFNPVNSDVYLTGVVGDISVERYRRDPGSGLLTFVDSTPIENAALWGGTYQGMYVEPLGRFGYVRTADNMIAGFSFDPDDGSLSPIDYDVVAAGVQHLDFGADADSIQNLGFEPSGHFVYFGFTAAGPVTLEKYRIDQATGELSQSTAQTELNHILGLGTVGTMAFCTRSNVPEPQPTFAYSRVGSSIGIYDIDPNTGMMSNTGSFVTSTFNGLYADPAHQYLYMSETSPPQYARVRIDQDTGALSDYETRTNATPNYIKTGSQGLRFDPHNRFAVQTRNSGDGMDLMEVVTGPPAGLGPFKTGIQFSEDPYTLTGTLGASSVRPNSRHLYSTGLVSGTVGSTARVLRMFELVSTPVFFDRVDASASAGHQDFPLSNNSAAYDTIVEPLGRYLLNIEVKPTNNSDNLAVYELDWATGLPTRRNAQTVPLVIPNYTTGPNPLHIVLDPRGRFVYVPTDNGIAAFRFTRDPSGPVLAVIDNDPSTVGLQLAQPMGGNSRLTIDPTGQWLYSPGSLGTEGFSIDQVTGVLTSVGIVLPTATKDLQIIGNL